MPSCWHSLLSKQGCRLRRPAAGPGPARFRAAIDEPGRAALRRVATLAAGVRPLRLALRLAPGPAIRLGVRSALQTSESSSSSQAASRRRLSVSR
jgi:hypothetical protein